MEGTEGDINAVLINVRNQVLQTTGGRQVPWGAFISDTSVPLFDRPLRPRLPQNCRCPGFPAHRARPRRQWLGDHQGYEQHSCARSLPQALPQRHLRRHGTSALAGTQADEGGQRAGSRAKDGDGPSIRAAGRGSRPPARTSPSPAPDLLSRSEAIKRISVWIERDFLNDNVTYAEVVDWYDQGTINRDAVLTDRAKYQERWPQRKYTHDAGLGADHDQRSQPLRGDFRAYSTLCATSAAKPRPPAIAHYGRPGDRRRQAAGGSAEGNRGALTAFAPINAWMVEAKSSGVSQSAAAPGAFEFLPAAVAPGDADGADAVAGGGQSTSNSRSPIMIAASGRTPSVRNDVGDEIVPCGRWCRRARGRGWRQSAGRDRSAPGSAGRSSAAWRWRRTAGSRRRAIASSASGTPS